jgi:hypothetical protein
MNHYSDLDYLTSFISKTTNYEYEDLCYQFIREKNRRLYHMNYDDDEISKEVLEYLIGFTPYAGYKQRYAFIHFITTIDSSRFL